MEKLMQFDVISPEFEPTRDIRFRNKNLRDLDKGELLEALCQALIELHRLQRS